MFTKKSNIAYTPQRAATNNISMAVEHTQEVLIKLGATQQDFETVDFEPALLEMLKALSGITMRVVSKKNRAIAEKFGHDYACWLTVHLPPEQARKVDTQEYIDDVYSYTAQMPTGTAIQASKAIGAVLPGAMSRSDKSKLETYLLGLTTTLYKRLKHFNVELDEEVDYRDYQKAS